MKVREFKAIIAQLEEEHHLLLITIELIESKMSSKFVSVDSILLKELLNSLDSRLKKHFRNEEEYHAKINFIDREKHREEHLKIEKMLDVSISEHKNKNIFKCLTEILVPHLTKDSDIVPPPRKSLKLIPY